MKERKKSVAAGMRRKESVPKQKARFFSHGPFPFSHKKKINHGPLSTSTVVARLCSNAPEVQSASSRNRGTMEMGVITCLFMAVLLLSVDNDNDSDDRQMDR